MNQHEKEYYGFQTRARGLLNPADLRQHFEKLQGWYHCRLKRFLPSDHTSSCLDLPCGYGNFLYFLESEGYSNVKGFDSDKAQVDLARTLGLPAQVADAFDVLSDSYGSYALIASLDFIEHLSKDDAMRFLSQCFEALQPGGCLILRTPSANGPFGSHDIWNDLTHQWGMTSTLLRAILEMKGFARIEMLDERPQPSSVIDTLRWLVYWPTRLVASMATMMLGMSPPTIWSRSMYAVAYKPGAMESPDSGKATQAVDHAAVRATTDHADFSVTKGSSACLIKRFMRNWALAFLLPRPFFGVRHIPWYFSEFFRYRRLRSGEYVHFQDMHPCLHDRVCQTPFDAHYLYQGGWLARHLHAKPSSLHVDVGSSVMMSSVLSGGIKMVVVDYRPLHAQLEGLVGVGADIVHLPFADESIESLSSLHVIEHIGLGRYGDELDAKGSIRAANELARVLRPGGRLYISAPVGRSRVCFNAHRVFSPHEVKDMFAGLRLVEFSFVDDVQRFHEKTEMDEAAGMEYACGMYVFEKQGVAD